MKTLLTEALTKLPRKGDRQWPGKGWFVEQNLHEWALEHGFLSGALFKKTKRWGTKSSTRFKLILVGPCPWTPGNLRYYTATIKT